MDRLLTLQMVEEATLTPARTLREWVRNELFRPPLPLPDGRELWRESAVLRWMDLLSATSVSECVSPGQGVARRVGQGVASNQSEADVLASEILQVLQEHSGEWVSGNDIAAAISEDVDRDSGTFRRATRILRDRHLIESGPMGFTLANPGQGGGQNFGQTVARADGE